MTPSFGAIISPSTLPVHSLFTYSDNTWWAFTDLAEWSGATKNMTLDDVRAIAQKIGTDLTMGNLRDFIGTDTGSGLYVRQYFIENSDYMLIVGSDDINTVMYADVIIGKNPRSLENTGVSLI